MRGINVETLENVTMPAATFAKSSPSRGEFETAKAVQVTNRLVVAHANRGGLNHERSKLLHRSDWLMSELIFLTLLGRLQDHSSIYVKCDDSQ